MFSHLGTIGTEGIMKRLQFKEHEFQYNFWIRDLSQNKRLIKINLTLAF